MKRYVEKGNSEYDKLINWRDYCEKAAMDVLDGKRHMLPIHKNEEVQKERDIFLYKYYEYNYEKAVTLLRKIEKLWRIY